MNSPAIEKKLNEPILQDDYPVNWGFYYVCDGKVTLSNIKGTVRELKMDEGCIEVRRCDLEGRDLFPNFMNGVEFNPPVKQVKPFKKKEKVCTKDLKPGDIIKFKFRGMKTRFRILGPDNIITENCFFHMVHYGDFMTPEEYLEHIKTLDFKNQTWLESYSEGESVSEHLTRIYIERL